MYNINMINGLAGSGKTHAIVSLINEFVANGDNVMLCQPTVALINQTISDLNSRFPDVIAHAIHKETSRSPVADINRYLFSPIVTPHALIITHTAFKRLTPTFMKYKWKVIVDEIPEVTSFFLKSLPYEHQIITRSINHIPDRSTRYGQLVSGDLRMLSSIAHNEGKDEVRNTFQSLANKVLSKDWITFTNSIPYSALISETNKAQYLETFSILQPSIFSDFKSVTIAGACLKETLLYKLWSQRGVQFHETHGDRLRFRAHLNGSEVELLWATKRNWSKWLAEEKEGRVLKAVENAVLNEFGDNQFLFSQNKSMKLFDGKPQARCLPNDPHGLNSFQEFENVAFLSARNLTPSQIKFLEVMMGVTGDVVHSAIHKQSAYQAIMRGALRDPNNHNLKRVFVPDLGTAKWLQGLFPGSSLRKIITELGDEIDRSIKDGKTRAKTGAERTRLYRERRKEEEAFLKAPLHSLDPPCHLLVAKNISTFRCDEKTISLNSKNVTNFYGTLWKNEKERFPSNIFVLDSLEDFEEFMVHLAATEGYKKKTDIPLISPSLFLPRDGIKSHRGFANVELSNGIFLDFDDGDLLPSEIPPLLPFLKMTILASHSSTSAHPRFRVYIPTETIMSGEQYRCIARMLVTEIEAAGYRDRGTIGDSKIHGIDKSKLNPTDLFRLPCQPKDPSGAFAEVFRDNGRKALNPREWLEKYVALEKTKLVNQMPPSEPSWPSHGSEVDEARVEKAIEEWRQVARTAHKDNDNFFLLGVKLKGAGCDAFCIRETLNQEAFYANTPKDRIRQIPSILNSLKMAA